MSLLKEVADLIEEQAVAQMLGHFFDAPGMGRPLVDFFQWTSLDGPREFDDWIRPEVSEHPPGSEARVVDLAKYYSRFGAVSPFFDERDEIEKFGNCFDLN